VRNTQARFALGTKIDTAFTHIALEFPKPQFFELCFAVGANRQYLILLFYFHYIMLQTRLLKPSTGGLSTCASATEDPGTH